MISYFTEITVNKGWIEMWCIAGVIFLVSKWLVVGRLSSGAFVFIWPGFDLHAWNRAAQETNALVRRGITNLTVGAALIWFIARHAPTPFIAIWLCMIGFVVTLHGGVFTLLTEFWRRRGHDVKPLMNCPVAAASVTEFWGKRWNLGFRDLSHTLIFKPLHRRFGKAIAISAVFLISGLAHELVITVPARGGYGGPTVYFLLQALCMAMERGCPFKRNGIVWRVRAWIFLVVPLPLLFPTVFVERVMQPFFTFIHALP